MKTNTRIRNRTTTRYFLHRMLSVFLLSHALLTPILASEPGDTRQITVYFKPGIRSGLFSVPKPFGKISSLQYLHMKNIESDIE